MPVRLPALRQYLDARFLVCPKTEFWIALHQILGRDAPWPLILGGADSTHAQKRARLDEQLAYADEHRLLVRADRYLRALPDEAWVHLGHREIERPREEQRKHRAALRARATDAAAKMEEAKRRRAERPPPRPPDPQLPLKLH